MFRDSADYNIESTIVFEVPGDWVETGLQYRVEVDELHPEIDVLPLPDQSPSFPVDPDALATVEVGPTPAVSPTFARAPVHLLLYDYQAGCSFWLQCRSASVQLNEEKLAIVRENLATLYPIVDLELTIAEPVLWTTPGRALR